MNGDRYSNCSVDYHGGARYAQLVRLAGKPDYFETLIRPRAPPH